MLSAATTAAPSQAGGSETAPRIRVAPREIHDVAYRALRVTGASAGEAQLAAQAVVRAEVDRADGLAMLLDELPRVSTRRVGGRLRPGPVAILADPAARGLFYTVPAAVDAVLATGPGRPVLIPGAQWRPAVESLVAVCTRSAPGSVRVVQLDVRQRSVAGDTQTIDDLTAAPPSDLPAGLLVQASTGERGPWRGAGSEEQRWVDAVHAGVFVGRAAWDAADAVARRFLVPERSINPPAALVTPTGPA